MPIQKGKGGNKRKKQKSQTVETKRKFTYKDDASEYAIITKLLGNCRFSVTLADGTEKLAIMRGKLRKREWVTVGSYVLVSIRDFEKDKCDIIMAYKSYENDKVKQFFNNNEDGQKQSGFVFTDTADTQTNNKQEVYFEIESSDSYEEEQIYDYETDDNNTDDI